MMKPKSCSIRRSCHRAVISREQMITTQAPGAVRTHEQTHVDGASTAMRLQCRPAMLRSILSEGDIAMTHLTRGPVLVRVALIPATLVLFVLVSGFLAQVPWATGLWPWSAKPLSYIFIGSILAAIAVPMLWISLTGEAAAVRAGALDLTVMYGGMFVYVLTLTGNPHEPRLWPYALAFGLATAGSAGAFLLARPVPWADPRSMPQPVRLSFGAFALVLTGAGVA